MGQNELSKQWLQSLTDDLVVVLRELVQAGGIQAGQLIVFGTSTSEVVGQRIGTAGTEEVAAHLFAAMKQVRAEVGFHPVYQCCEHLNRALVIEKEALAGLREIIDEVTVIPVPGAGGSMASYAYKQFTHPVVIEEIRADAGIDIGQTFIGMHLRKVAVPVRPSKKRIGEAIISMAYTRPKLIGGARATYECT